MIGRLAVLAAGIVAAAAGAAVLTRRRAEEDVALEDEILEAVIEDGSRVAVEAGDPDGDETRPHHAKPDLRGNSTVSSRPESPGPW